MRRWISVLLISLLCLAWLPVQATAAGDSFQMAETGQRLIISWLGQVQKPQVSAESYIVIDMTSGRILEQKNIHERRAPASLTKMMTALVALKEAGPDAIVAVDPTATQIDEKKIGLRAGELITVDGLIRAALIASGNDAAMALGLVKDANRPVFVEKMNQQAREWGMADTTFRNTVGVDADGHLSSVYDMALLSLHLLRDPYLREIVQRREDTVYPADGSARHVLRNSNTLLQTSDEIKGVKTGITDQAGGTLSLLGERQGRQVLVVLFGSQDRFADGQALMDWAYRSSTWVTVRLPVVQVSGFREFLFAEPLFSISWREVGVYNVPRF